MISPKCLAPARIQFFASSLIFWNRAISITDLLFSSGDVPFFPNLPGQQGDGRFRPLGWVVGAFIIACCQCASTVCRLAPKSWTKEGQESHEAAACQIRLEYLHSNRMCLAVSPRLLHSWHKGSWGHPLIARRSEVHSLFCTTSHGKNLHFGGTHVLQTRLSKEQGVEPMN